MIYDILLTTGHVVQYNYTGEDDGDGGVIEAAAILAEPNQHIIGTLLHPDAGTFDGYVHIKPEHVVSVSTRRSAEALAEES